MVLVVKMSAYNKNLSNLDKIDVGSLNIVK